MILRSYVVFRASDVKDLQIESQETVDAQSQPPMNDPAIVTVRSPPTASVERRTCSNISRPHHRLHLPLLVRTALQIPNSSINNSSTPSSSSNSDLLILSSNTTSTLRIPLKVLRDMAALLSTLTAMEHHHLSFSKEALSEEVTDHPEEEEMEWVTRDSTSKE